VKRPLAAALWIVVPAIVLCGLGAGRAQAAGEDEWQLSARLGGANANGNPLAPWGLAGALDVEYGLDDAWSARASVGSLMHPVKGVPKVSPDGTLTLMSAVVGLTYTFDVLRLVPYASGGIGMVRFSGGNEPAHATLAMDLGVGADYLLTPRWACGASAQYIFAPADLLNNAMALGETPLAFSLTLRLSRIF
jgi:opacity protein-like surface antigen